MNAGKSHPDRAILLAFKKKRMRLISWTPKETSLLIKAVQKYGKNYQMISNAVKTRDVNQCSKKLLGMKKQIASDPKHENAKHAKVLKKIPVRVKYKWTDKEKKRFNEALQKHGKDYQKIKKYFPELTMERIRSRANTLKLIIRKDKNYPDFYLK